MNKLNILLLCVLSFSGGAVMHHLTGHDVHEPNGDWSETHLADFPNGYHTVTDRNGREYYVIKVKDVVIVPKYPLTSGNTK